MPLDRLLTAVPDVPPDVRDASETLEHTGVLMVGVGYEQALRDAKSWMYYPGSDVPFYRVTNFAKYAPANVPDSDVGRYSSYMTETAYSPYKRIARAELEDAVERGLRASGTVTGQPKVASIHVEDIEYAYPVPTIRRDEALEVIQPWLPIGRFTREAAWCVAIRARQHGPRGQDGHRHRQEDRDRRPRDVEADAPTLSTVARAGRVRVNGERAYRVDVS